MQTIRRTAPSDSDSSSEVSSAREYYSVAQAAARLGVSRVTIWRWIRAGQLPVWRLGQRTTRIKHEDLERLLVRGGPAGSRTPRGAEQGAGLLGGDESEHDGGILAAWTEPGAGEHVVQFYETDTHLVEVVSRYVGAALGRDDAAIIVATPAHRAAVADRLVAEGVDLAAAVASGRYLSLDAAETLARFMTGEMPDPERFATVIGGLITRAGRGGHEVCIFGEMVALLVDEGNPAAALRLEALWNELRETHAFTLMCGYPIDSFSDEALAEQFGEVCAAHAGVIPTERFAALAGAEDQRRAIVEWQRRARALEAEVARRQRAETRAQEALAAERRKERELRDYVETAPLALHWVGADGTILWANRAEMELLGYHPEEYIGHHIAEFHADADIIDDILTRLTCNETLREYPARLRCKDGSVKHVLIDSSVLWEDGEFRHTRCFTRDVTDRQQMEEARAQLAAIVASAEDAIIGKTLDAIVTSWNPGAERMYGYTAAEMIGQPIARLIPADHPGELTAIMERLRRGERIEHFQTERVRKDGQRLSVSVSISPIRDARGEIVGASAIARDITEQQRQAEALRLSEERLRLALEAGRMESWDWSVETGQVVWSPNMEVIHGCAPGSLGGQFEDFASGIHAEDRERVLGVLHGALERGEPYQIEYRNVRPDGRTQWLETRGEVLRDEQGKPVRMMGVCADITERMAAEQALREERETLATLNRLGQTIAAELDLGKLVQAVTDAATEVAEAEFGAFFYNAVDERGETYQLYTLAGVPREAFAQFPMPRNTELFGPTFRGEGIVRLADVRHDPRYGKNAPYYGMPAGHLPVVSYLAVPVLSRSGEVLGGLFFGHAEPGRFTERAERLVAGLAAMAAVAMDNAHLYRQVQDAVRARDGFLAAAAHDLKTPLTSIKGMAQLLQRRLARAGVPATDGLAEGLAGIDTTVTKMAEQLDELLDLTRLQLGQPLELRRRSTDLVELARRVTAEQQKTTERHHIRVETGRAELRGWWDGVRLTRVLDNLVSNAVKYSPDRSEVTVTVKREDADGQAWAVLVVRDQGLGIPAADLPQIFERFTRASNVTGRIAGTGIGLASARQIVEQHDGTISVETEEGVGSTFTVRLPLGDEDDGPGGGARGPESVLAGDAASPDPEQEGTAGAEAEQPRRSPR
ncbi:MAG TPA: PAS domain S-box protein [Chloroflexota bacterium]|jgi:PAS domain S-box-containing protein/excisionase family DNA binding protein